MDRPDPLLLVAVACYPQILSLDDLLAARCVCKAWRHSLGTAFCNTWRLPYSLWHNAAAEPRFAAAISTAAAAYSHASHLLLDSGGTRPVLQPSIWPALTRSLNPWLASASPGALRCVQLQLHAPPSPQQLSALQALPCLGQLQLQHTPQALYSRHLAALASLSQLHSLALHMVHPRLELRSLSHQRLRRRPLQADCLSCLTQLSRLEISSIGHAGELLPDTVAAFNCPDSLAAFTGLQHLALSEAALRGPWLAEQWLQPLTGLLTLQLVQLDDPSLSPARGKAGSNCSMPGGAAAGSAAGLLGTSGGLGAAITAAAQAAGATRSDQQALLQSAQQSLWPALAGLGNAAVASSSSGSGNSGGGTGRLRASSSSGGGGINSNGSYMHAALPPASPHNTSTAGQLAASRLSRASSSTSNGEATDTAGHPTAGGPLLGTGDDGALPPPLPALNLGACLPNLTHLTLANMAGERLVKLSVPTGLTQLVLHLAHPCPSSSISGEQLSAIVMQSAQTLEVLELGLGMRFSLSGAVMRALKRGLKRLQRLTFLEGAQDHLEGLGCWCNLPHLTLVEGRCSVPLRGLYELSMRAAMGRTPGVLRYSGHVRHMEELATRLGSAVHELRLDSLAGLSGSNRRSQGLNLASSGSGTLAAPSDQQQRQPVSSSRGSSSAGGGGGSSSGGSSGQESLQPEMLPLHVLAQLSSMTRLEIVGDQIGQLDVGCALALGSCKQVKALHIQADEPWLAADLGVKEQLEWLAELRQLRQLRLAGVMRGRSKLAGEASGVSKANSISSTAGKGSRGGGSSGSAAKASGGCRASSIGSCSGNTVGQGSHQGSHAVGGIPAVKGLGNGLSCSAGGSRIAAGAGPAAKSATVLSSNAAKVAPAAAPAAVGAATLSAKPLQDPAAAAARDVSVASSLEELRRWLQEMLPDCRVWLD